MYLSNPKRIYLVLEYLIKHPRRAADYFRHCCFSKSPLEKGLPWWSYEAIDWVSKNLNTIHSVFEWGSGGSTIFIPLCKKVLSIENDLKWHRMVINEVERLSIQNVTILKREINLSSMEAFKKSDYHKSLGEKHDLIVIDGEDSFGPEMKWSAREVCFELAERWVNTNGFILVDDAWRYPKIAEQTNAKKRVRFQSIGPCRKGITSTDIHFY